MIFIIISEVLEHDSSKSIMSSPGTTSFARRNGHQNKHDREFQTCHRSNQNTLLLEAQVSSSSLRCIYDAVPLAMPTNLKKWVALRSRPWQFNTDTDDDGSPNTPGRNRIHNRSEKLDKGPDNRLLPVAYSTLRQRFPMPNTTLQSSGVGLRVSLRRIRSLGIPMRRSRYMRAHRSLGGG